MTSRMKRLLVALLLGAGLAAASGAGPVPFIWAGHKQGTACHGTNQVPCRPDPQPDHGNDCGDNSTYPLNSNDHCGEEIPL